jgi:hypothetical protein
MYEFHVEVRNQSHKHRESYGKLKIIYPTFIQLTNRFKLQLFDLRHYEQS